MTHKDDGRDALRESGHRLTPQRVLVWDVLRRAGDRHMSAEQIFNEVQKTLPTFNVASVYRTLSLLAELGLAKETRLPEGPAVWEIAHDHQHHHLVCRRCGSITHHEEPALSQVALHLLQQHGFAAEELDLLVTGLCLQCRERTAR
jgi:Fur family transcriptional regulator, ferric uptake regulator